MRVAVGVPMLLLSSILVLLQLHLQESNTILKEGNTLINSTLLPGATGGFAAASHADGMADGVHRKKIPSAAADKSKILRLLKAAGIASIDNETINQLPEWSHLTSTYGPLVTPVIFGLDTCPKFKYMRDPEYSFIAPAGAFNTGTNLLSVLLQANCGFPTGLNRTESKVTYKKGRHRYFKDQGIQWQVPWGKHVQPSESSGLRHKANLITRYIDPRAVLPVVVIKDPYTWLASMCRHPYTARWEGRKEHCPNLVPDAEDLRRGIHGNAPDGGVPVEVVHTTWPPRPGAKKIRTEHSSLVGLWNDFYSDYYEKVDFPRLIVRYEDLMLQPQEVLTRICECGGGQIKNPKKFTIVKESAKGNLSLHNGSSGLVGALIRYGSPTKRVAKMTDGDLTYARKKIRSDLMEAFGYAHPGEGLNVSRIHQTPIVSDDEAGRLREQWAREKVAAEERLQSMKESMGPGSALKGRSKVPDALHQDDAQRKKFLSGLATRQMTLDKRPVKEEVGDRSLKVGRDPSDSRARPYRYTHHQTERSHGTSQRDRKLTRSHTVTSDFRFPRRRKVLGHVEVGDGIHLV
jgi:hypothetical protein